MRLCGHRAPAKLEPFIVGSKRVGSLLLLLLLLSCEPLVRANSPLGQLAMWRQAAAKSDFGRSSSSSSPAIQRPRVVYSNVSFRMEICAKLDKMTTSTSTSTATSTTTCQDHKRGFEQAGGNGCRDSKCCDCRCWRLNSTRSTVWISNKASIRLRGVLTD